MKRKTNERKGEGSPQDVTTNTTFAQRRGTGRRETFTKRRRLKAGRDGQLGEKKGGLRERVYKASITQSRIIHTPKDYGKYNGSATGVWELGQPSRDVRQTRRGGEGREEEGS